MSHEQIYFFYSGSWNLFFPKREDFCSVQFSLEFSLNCSILLCFFPSSVNKHSEVMGNPHYFPCVVNENKLCYYFYQQKSWAVMSVNQTVLESALIHKSTPEYNQCYAYRVFAFKGKSLFSFFLLIVTQLVLAHFPMIPLWFQMVKIHLYKLKAVLLLKCVLSSPSILEQSEPLSQASVALESSATTTTLLVIYNLFFNF